MAARIIVAGAGPAGLTAALVLASRGIPVTVLEKGDELAFDLRAGSYHPPTLEMLAPYGVTQRMHEDGIIARTWQVRDRKLGLIGEFDLDLLKDETPYPYRLHLEQHKLTPILLDAARAYPEFEIRFGCEVTGASQTADGVRVAVREQDSEDTVEGTWLVGTDGHHSAVRAAIGTEFEGFTWPEAFVVISTTHDFEPYGYAYATYIADPDEFVILFKMPGFNPPPIWRVVFPVDPEQPREALLDAAFNQGLLQGFHPQSTPYDMIHVTLYRVHQRVATTFNAGRIAVAGDAAHVNNPLGAMGLNGAVHDAVNLADKLTAAWRGEGGPELLDLYTRQRRPAQIEFVQQITIRNKRTIEERDPVVRQRRFDEIRATAEDPKRAYTFLMNTSMINSLRRANSIT